MKLLNSISKEQYWDYFILVARFLIGWTFLGYGYSKLTENQFGISEAEFSMPLKELSLFKVSWYLFDMQPFKAFIGVSQIICGSLLIINRTAIIGAFMFLPIVATILIIDLTFMPTAMANAFTWRLSFYILLDLLVLWHYKAKMEVIWNQVWQQVNTRFKYPVWMYLLLPVAAITLEITSVLPKVILSIISQPTQMWSQLQDLVSSIGKLF